MSIYNTTATSYRAVRFVRYTDILSDHARLQLASSHTHSHGAGAAAWGLVLPTWAALGRGVRGRTVSAMRATVIKTLGAEGGALRKYACGAIT
eukprot:3398962-Pleurochrysis_carterae.AAC.3